MKKTPYNEFLQEQLQDPELKREYDSVEVEFALARGNYSGIAADWG